jgi:hypothetical protein
MQMALFYFPAHNYGIDSVPLQERCFCIYSGEIRKKRKEI